MSYRSLQLTLFLLLFICLFTSPIISNGQGTEGYYRYPTIHGNTVAFSAEGDIWTVALSGGLAQRLTTHQEEERFPKISPDGLTIAYTASYEGPNEVYTIPIDGGIPKRWTYESDYSVVNGWTPDGKIMYDTRAYSTLPARQLVSINTATFEKKILPLSQASESSYNTTGNTLYFVRPSFHGNVTKRYKGGTARQIWKFDEGSSEAKVLTGDYAGEGHHPMWFNNRIYFITDRDGTMNIWSMDENGNDKKQHTSHAGFDIRYASMSSKVKDGNIVYQLAADLWHYDILNDKTVKIDIRISSDLDHQREKWVDKPSKYITSVNPDSNGDKIVITARGRAFVAPTKAGRFIEFTDKKDVRYRDAIFSHDGKEVITLSDESGEFEFISFPANGLGEQKNLTNDGKILRYAAVTSPDGKWLAYDDLSQDLYVFNTETKENRKISSNQEGISSLSWSSDSQWLCYAQAGLNTMYQLFIYNNNSQESKAITTDRANSYGGVWSPDGKFIYLISDRNFNTLVGSPWGPRQPEPYFDVSEKIYEIALEKETRSPFRAHDELVDEKKAREKEEKINKEKSTEKDSTKEKGKNKKKSKVVEKVDEKKETEDKTKNIKIDFDGIIERIREVPVKAGNYSSIAVNDKAIYLRSRGKKANLSVIKITNKKPEIKTMIESIRSFKLTSDGKKILVSKAGSYYMVNAGTGKLSDISSNKIDLSGWQFSMSPKDDWKQLFTDAWRMERDYFYDKNMHGVDWNKMYDKYLPLVDRITTRVELSDLIGRFVGELSALHTSVRGGDTRSDNKNISVSSLGAFLERDNLNNGFRITKIYKADPDYPNEKSPLDDPYLNIKEGDIITKVNGKSALTAVDFGALIRNKKGKQIRLSIKSGTSERDIIIKPMGSDANLRYRDWEYSRRLAVDKKSENKIGYVHLRAMGRNDINQWYREFYPIYNRQGLIIDVRNNRGGNIESFILEKLLRKPWMYWSGRSGEPSWNMQYAFRGHIVVLVDQNTASDGEAFADGFRRLELGKTIGMRTWGGEIWLGSQNRMSDGGLARAPMNGVYGPEGKWLIEGHGFVPDIEVDNLPHATFKGHDAQLEAAIKHLEELIKIDPRSVPKPPARPDKSFDNN